MLYMGSIFSLIRKVRSVITFGAGVLVGMSLSVAGYAYATEIIATLSTQPIYVDGEQVEMTAYSINGNNYLKLRDVGEAVGFYVSYNADTNSVHIDTTAPYTTEEVTTTTTTSPTTVADMVTVTHTGSSDVKDYYTVTVDNATIEGKLSSGTDITEANINAMVDEVLAIFPDDSEWGAPYNDGDEYSYFGITGCNSFTYMMEDIIWGADSQRQYSHNDLSQVRAGDAVYLYNAETSDAHWIFVTGTEEFMSPMLTGGYEANMMISWVAGNSGACVCDTAQPFLATLASYPDSVIYCYY